MRTSWPASSGARAGELLAAVLVETGVGHGAPVVADIAGGTSTSFRPKRRPIPTFSQPYCIAQWPQLLPILRDLFAAMTMEQATAACEKSRIPFAAIARPEDLFTDPHLEASGGLMATTLPNGVHTRLPKLPVALRDVEFAVRRDPPAVGEDTLSVLGELGFDEAASRELIAQGIVAAATVDRAPTSR